MSQSDVRIWRPEVDALVKRLRNSRGSDYDNAEDWSDSILALIQRATASSREEVERDRDDWRDRSSELGFDKAGLTISLENAMAEFKRERELTDAVVKERDAARADLAALRNRMEEAAREDDETVVKFRWLASVAEPGAVVHEEGRHVLAALDSARASNAELRGMLARVAERACEGGYCGCCGAEWADGGGSESIEHEDDCPLRPDVTAATDTGGREP